MKIKKIKYVLLSLLFTPLTCFADNGGEEIIDDCSSILGAEVVEILKYVYTGAMISIPCITLILIVKDMVTAVAAGKADDMKKAQSTAIKRLVIGVAILFIPILIKAIINLTGIATCK